MAYCDTLWSCRDYGRGFLPNLLREFPTTAFLIGDMMVATQLEKDRKVLLGRGALAIALSVHVVGLLLVGHFPKSTDPSAPMVPWWLADPLLCIAAGCAIAGLIASRGLAGKVAFCVAVSVFVSLNGLFGPWNHTSQESFFRSGQAKAAAGDGRMVYFIDTSNWALLVRPKADVPPLIGATGKPTVVRAVFFTYTSCKNKKLLYLLKYTPTEQKILMRLQHHHGGDKSLFAIEMQTILGTLVRLPVKGSHWFLANSPTGQRIMTPPADSGRPAHFCNPAN